MNSFSIELQINPKLYVRDPQRSDVGRRILKHSILLIDEIGLERFTFKKLAEKIETTEAGIYRYFANKQMLLLYLINWYWEWMKVHINLSVQNIEEPVERLRRAIAAVVNTAQRNTNVEFIDEDVLHRIVAVEGTKAYHHKSVDEQNKEGYFIPYKSLCTLLADFILAVDPDFPWPRALATNILEMASNHVYFALHLPRLTDVKAGPDTLEQVTQLIETFTLSLLNIPARETQTQTGGALPLEQLLSHNGQAYSYHNSTARINGSDHTRTLSPFDEYLHL